MASGVDKLELLTKCVRRKFLFLARRDGWWEGKFQHVIDLRKTHYELPVILFCDGVYDGRHKIRFVGVAQLGLKQTIKILKRIVFDVSSVKIYRIDVCTDVLGLWVWDLADRVLVSHVQNFTIINNRGGATFYIQNSQTKTIVLYDKIKQYAAERDPMARVFDPGDQLTRVEVRLNGNGVPFKKIRDLHRYLEIDFLENLRFLKLRMLRKGAKPLHRLAAAQLRDMLQKYGLHATKKRFSPSQWAYLEKTLFQTLEGKEIPDLQLRLRRSLNDWLENRLRFPRCHDLPKEEAS